MRLSTTKGHSATAGNIWIKIISETIGNRTRDLPACSAVLPMDNVQSNNVSWSSLYTCNVFALSAHLHCRLPGSFQFAQKMQRVINLFYTLFSKCKQLPIIMQEESPKQSYVNYGKRNCGNINFVFLRFLGGFWVRQCNYFSKHFIAFLGVIQFKDTLRTNLHLKLCLQ